MFHCLRNGLKIVVLEPVQADIICRQKSMHIAFIDLKKTDRPDLLID